MDIRTTGLLETNYEAYYSIRGLIFAGIKFKGKILSRFIFADVPFWGIFLGLFPRIIVLKNFPVSIKIKIKIEGNHDISGTDIYNSENS